MTRFLITKVEREDRTLTMFVNPEFVEVEIRHEARYWNPNCGCFIPEAYTAFVCVDGEQLPKWPCGSSYKEARANVLREYPTATFS